MANEPSMHSLEASTPPGTSAPIVSVIIPHYNDLANLEQCMRLLAAQTLPRGRFEVVVADNNSRCGLMDVERACGGLARVIRAPIQGAGAARNAAVEASRGRYLAFIDSDCRPAPTWLERGLAALSSAEIVGGQVDVDVEDPAHPTAVEAYEKVFAFNFKRYIEQVGFSGSGNMLVSREVFDHVGGFRDQVSEDVDWGKRAIAAGYRLLYAPDVIVSHPARRTWAELTKSGAGARASRSPQPSSGPMAAQPGFSAASPFSPRHSRIGSTVARSDKLRNAGDRLKAIGVLFRIRFWRFVECNRLLLRR